MRTDTDSSGCKTVWLLDVDGVLNCNTPVVSWGDSKVKSVRDHFDASWNIKWSPTLIGLLKEIIADGKIEVVWSTTWVDHIDVLEKLWDLPPLRRAFWDLPTQYTGDFKWNAARDVLADGRRLIWTDDTEVPLEGGRRWTELKKAGECLLISPNERLGLTPDHLREIIAFGDLA